MLFALIAILAATGGEANKGLAQQPERIAETIPFPREIAFNRGILEMQALEEAKKRQIADHQARGRDHDIVRHLRIEVFDNSRAASIAQTTMFAFCESEFHSTLTRSRDLHMVRVEYIMLDSHGKPLSLKTWIARFSSNYDKQTNKLFWTRELIEGRDIKAFHEAIPLWAKEKLWLTSGFLAKNPGQQVVPYSRPDEDVIRFIGELLDFAPGIAKKALYSIGENALKKASKLGLEEAVKNNEAKWGGANDVTGEKANSFSTDYKKEGKRMWGS